MKKLFFIFLVFMLSNAARSQAQVDTLGLLKQTFLNNKSSFVGKPFSTLVNALPASLPIKNYDPEPFSKMNRKTDFGFMSMDNLRGGQRILYTLLYIGKIRPVKIVNLPNGENCRLVNGIKTT